MNQRRQGMATSQADHAGAARRGRAGWPIALIVVWATLAVADSVFVLTSGAASAPLPSRQHRTPGAVSRPHFGLHERYQRRPPARAVRLSPRPSPTVTSLAPVSIAPFGPSGTASGDNPGSASLAIDGSMQTAWASDWYRSAAFGNLQTGTGLLLDMGHPVRIGTVRILLGSERGADVTLVAERMPGVPAGRSQATADDVVGAVRFRLARARRERYLLIWFTLLPPDPAGTFQASVHNIAIAGTP